MPKVKREIVTRTLVSHTAEQVNKTLACWAAWMLVNESMTMGFAAPVKGSVSAQTVTALDRDPGSCCCCGSLLAMRGTLTRTKQGIYLQATYPKAKGLRLKVVIRATPMRHTNLTALVATVEMTYPWHRSFQAARMHREWLRGCMALPALLSARRPVVQVDGSVVFARGRTEKKATKKGYAHM